MRAAQGDTIQPMFGVMVTVLMAKFILNDVPHAAGLFTNYPNRKLYHVSPISNLKVLTPSMPKEDIINGEVVWDRRYAGFVSGKIGLPESSKCVCFAANLRATLAINALHDVQCYIYVPETNEVPRAIWEEVKEEFKDILTIDLISVKEYRFYKPVPVKLVGEALVSGSVTKVHWYPNLRQ